MSGKHDGVRGKRTRRFAIFGPLRSAKFRHEEVKVDGKEEIYSTSLVA